MVEQLEAYLTQFVTAFIPSPFLSLSGFVADCRGHEVSPQLDLLIADGNSIPLFMLGNSVGIVPLESVRLIVEVKSTLKTSDFDQLQLQQDTFRKMRFSWTSADRRYLKTVNCEYKSQIIVAFDSNCSQDTLKKWFTNVKGLSAICVVQRFIMLKNRRKDVVEIINADDSHSEVLHLISFVQSEIRNAQIEHGSPHTLETPEGLVDMFPDIGAYLTFDVPEPK